MVAKKRAKLEKIVLGYVTTKNVREARKIGEALIDKRLAACVNIIPNMISVYRWQGKVEKASEVILLIKSTVNKKNKITDEVKRLHSYTLPCVLFFETKGGNLDYSQWLNQECS